MALFVVADGMGGLSYGSQASQYITEQFQRWWQQDLPQMLLAGHRRDNDIRELLEQEIWDINQSILRFSEEKQCRAGSTLSLLLLFQGKYYIVNLGDSRIYRLRGGTLACLTTDQSLKAQIIRERGLTEGETGNLVPANILTMCMGVFEIPQNYYTQGKLREGDSFLLCSDGFYKPLGEEQICYVLSGKGINTQTKLNILKQMIVPETAKDNFSAIFVEIKKKKRGFFCPGG